MYVPSTCPKIAIYPHFLHISKEINLLIVDHLPATFQGLAKITEFSFEVPPTEVAEEQMSI
jgi:hypothetical protein